MRKKFLFFIPTLETGGAEKCTIILMNELSRKGYDLRLLTCKSDGPLRNDIDHKIILIETKKSSVSKSLIDIALYIRKWKPDVVFSIMNYCNIIVLLSCLISGHRSFKVISERQSIFNSINSYNRVIRPFARYLTAIIYRFSDRIITVSSGLKKELISTFPRIKKKIITINNGFNLDQVKHLSKMCSEIDIFNSYLRKNINLLVACGRLVYEKDYFSLIETAKLLKAKNINYHLFILGDGPLKEEIKIHIQKSNLKEKVTLLGNVKNPYAFIAKADLLLLSSIKEGLPGVIIQALLCETQVISTDCNYGPSEILKNGEHGTLVRVKDPYAMSEAIIERLKNPKRINIKEIRKQYNIINVADRYIEIIQSNI